MRSWVFEVEKFIRWKRIRYNMGKCVKGCYCLRFMLEEICFIVGVRGFGDCWWWCGCVRGWNG